jgi:hypothetical protein
METARLNASFNRPKSVSAAPAPKKWDVCIVVGDPEDNKCRLVVTQGFGLVTGGAERVTPWTVATPVSQLKAAARRIREKWSDELKPIPELAEAGNDLFTMLFGIEGEKELPPEAQDFRDGLLQHIQQWVDAQRSSAEIQAPALQIQIVSRTLHLPWNLLYPLQDFAEPIPQAFLGFVFCIEEDPMLGKAPSEGFGKTTPTHVSLQMDRLIDKQYRVHEQVEDALQMFDDQELSRIPRPQSNDLKQALGTSDVADEIIYFCCHGYSDTKDLPYLRLTDRKQHITPIDIGRWMKGKKFKRYPIVFLNTCHGGQLDEDFSPAFVAAFVERHAVAVLGPVAEIPTHFAGRFASEFFDLLFSGQQQGTPQKCIGDIVREIRLSQFLRSGTLYGLLYSVYSVVPVSFQRQLGRRNRQAPKSVVPPQDAGKGQGAG